VFTSDAPSFGALIGVKALEAAVRPEGVAAS
jgi:hypothetical protein